MIQKLYLEGEAHALLMAGLESFQASNMYVCACTYSICAPGRCEQRPDTFGCELHLCLCCQYT